MVLFPEVNGVPVTWDDPLSVPSGGNGVVQRVDPTAWPAHTAGGRTVWRVRILTAGDEGDDWHLHVGAEQHEHSQDGGDTPEIIAAALHAAAAAPLLALGYTLTVAGDTLTSSTTRPDYAQDPLEVHPHGTGTVENVVGQLAGVPTGFDPQPTP